MSDLERRTFLKLMGSGAVALSMPDSIRRALTVPAHNRTGRIDDVEHIVILMQENRSFDHYFGTMRGVRGFNDPHPITLPSGKPVWNQPDGLGGELLPFRPDVVDLGMSFLPDPPHNFTDTHAAWNGGRMDQFPPNKGVDSMAYHLRSDIPYQYALADAFTVCDAYYCSVMGPTDPNRYHLWTGWVGNDGAAGGPVITNAEAGYDWSTYPERLERAGVSWKVYQDIGVGLTAEGFWGWTGDQPYIGNYGDNSLLYFHQYQNALPGNPLADKAKVGTNIANQGTLFDMFRGDVESGNLPQVTWIVAPEALSEHPNWAPDFGAWYVSQIVDILASNPAVFGKTVLFVNYDEEGGFFDHMVPPTPASTPDVGASTVDIVNEIYPGDPDRPANPYGLGMRVPMIVVSPWSKGGWVNSQVFDHTSVIQFIEARFAGSNTDLIESNITPWRRAVAGDLTSAFNFKTPNARMPSLPTTDGFEPVNTQFYPNLDVVPPMIQAVPRQERGVKLARPLPYTLEAHAAVNADDGSVEIAFVNSGSQAAVFHVHSANLDDAPRTYTVEPGKQLSGMWIEGPQYGLEVRAPNGFFRSFDGDVAGTANLDVRASYRARHGEITLTMTNLASARATVIILDKYTGRRTERRIGAGETERRHWSVDRMNGWYDLVVTIDGDASFGRRIAGHVETGKNSTSDPGMGGLVVHA